MKAAAFYDLEGTLIRTNLVHTLAFFSANQQGLGASVLKTLKTVGSIPLFMLADVYSRKVFNNLYFQYYRGESEDRLRYLAEELHRKVLLPAVYPGAYELIEQARRRGLHQVLVTGAIDFTIAPLVEHLGLDDYVANRLEFVGGIATGRLLPPVLAAATKASWIRGYAERHEINLNESYGYSDSMSDLPMLSIVGYPAAVNPDTRLRSTAVRHDWPVLQLT